MSNRGKTLVKGHTLFREGWPCYSNGAECTMMWTNGHAVCSCGAVSECLDSTAARKRWHRLHKQEVKEKQCS